MKSIMIVLFAFFAFSINGIAQTTPTTETDELVGNWILDMSPEDKTDSNFATMEITKIADNKIRGTFYSSDVRFRDGNINRKANRIYGALVSGDNSGSYNTSFYYEDGKLYGTTHALGRDFLAVWVATKEE